MVGGIHGQAHVKNPKDTQKHVCMHVCASCLVRLILILVLVPWAGKASLFKVTRWRWVTSLNYHIKGIATLECSTFDNPQAGGEGVGWGWGGVPLLIR